MGTNCSNIEYADANITDEVAAYMGPRCLDGRVAVATVFFYTLILVLGTLGNLFTCVVIWRNPYMHTATNYYLFSLAVSDLISLLMGLPFELRTTLTFVWPDILPESLCKLRSFITEMTSNASILTITAFSIERWLAICFPLKVKLFSKLNRAVKVIMVVWVLACISAVPILLFAILNRMRLPDRYFPGNDSENGTLSWREVSDDGRTVRFTDLCALDTERPNVSSLLLNLSFYCFFLVPMITICILYAHIGITIRNAARRQHAINDAVKLDAKRLKRRTSVMKMLVAVVVAFFACWLPFHIQRLLSTYPNSALSPEMTEIFNTVFYVSGYFYYANSAVNPVLYNALNVRFRRAFVRTLCSCCTGLAADSQQQHILEVSGMRSSHSNAKLSSTNTYHQHAKMAAIAASAANGNVHSWKWRRAAEDSRSSATKSNPRKGSDLRQSYASNDRRASNFSTISCTSTLYETALCNQSRLRPPSTKSKCRLLRQASQNSKNLTVSSN